MDYERVLNTLKRHARDRAWYRDFAEPPAAIQKINPSQYEAHERYQNATSKGERP